MSRVYGSNVIIIGGHTLALFLARIFGRENIPIYLVYDKFLNITRFSRYTTNFLKAPKGTTSYLLDETKEKMLVDFLMGLPERLSDSIVLSTNDAVAYVLSKHKMLLSKKYRVCVPPINTFMYVYNKKRSIEICKKVRVPTPTTIFSQEIDEVNFDTLRYPALIKGIIGHRFYKTMGKKAFLIKNEKELKEGINFIKTKTSVNEVMIQEVISMKTKDVYSFGSYSRDGDVIGFWIGQKLREHPEVFGTGNAARSKYVSQVEDYGRKFLNEIKYSGISEVEFIYDRRDNDFKFIEINGRPWLQIGLANRCGVNLPLLLFKDMIGEQIQPINGFKEDVVWIHFWPDIIMALKGILSGNLSLSEYLSTLRGEIEFCVIDKNDMLPFFIETFTLPYLWKIRGYKIRKGIKVQRL